MAAANKQKKQKSHQVQQQAAATQSKDAGNNKKQGKKSTSSATSKTSSSVCPWLFGIFLLFGAIAGVISYDTYTTGGGVFEKSTTGKFLKDTGALPHIQLATTTTLHYSARGYQWAELNVPIFYTGAKQVLLPYVEVTRVLALNVWNGVSELVVKKTPIVAKFIDQYIPGASKTIADVSKTTWDVVSSVSVKSYKTGCDFFKTKVFIGQLSPENLSKALNQTQNRAAEYYSWFYQKVDAYAKIKTT